MLNDITTGKQKIPPLICIYGEEGIGKSTFACKAPTPLVFDIEDSTKNIDVARLGSEKFTTAMSIYERIQWLRENEHPYKTLVIDSVDWMEALIFKDVAEGAKKTNIADIPYGTGYKDASNRFRFILDALRKLRDEKNVAVILVGHSQIKRFDDPINESYDRHQLKLHDSNSALIMEWAEVVLFATKEVFIESKEKRFNKTINKGKPGEHILLTTSSPAYRAKNRFNLPEQLPLSWDAFAGALSNA